MPIVFHASSFAACIGKHPYTKQHDAIEAVWKRAFPVSYREAQLRHHRQTAGDRVHELSAHVEAVRETLTEATTVATQASSTDTIMENTTRMAEKVASLPLDESDKKLVQDEVRKQLFTQYGTTKERSVLDYLDKEMELALAPPTDTCYKRQFMTPSGYPWTLLGKIDAHTMDGKILIEVKNRMRKLFLKIPMYERIQVECYLRLVPDADFALLVESLAIDQNRVINMIPVYRDETLWAECEALGHKVVDILQRMATDTDLQDAYMSSKRPSHFIRTLLQ